MFLAVWGNSCPRSCNNSLGSQKLPASEENGALVRNRVRKNSISIAGDLEGKTWTCSQYELSDKAIFYTLSVIPLLFSPSSNFSPVNIILLHSFLHLLFSKPRTCPQSTYTIILQLHSPATFPTANSSSLQHPACLPACLQVFFSLCFGFDFFFCCFSVGNKSIYWQRNLQGQKPF